MSSSASFENNNYYDVTKYGSASNLVSKLYCQVWREREREMAFFKQMQLQSFLLTSSTFTLFPRMGTIQQAAGACDDLPRPTLGTRTRHPDSRRRDRRERRRPRPRTGEVANSRGPHDIFNFGGMCRYYDTTSYNKNGGDSYGNGTSGRESREV